MYSQILAAPVPLCDFCLIGIVTHAKAYPNIARLFVEEWIDRLRAIQIDKVYGVKIALVSVHSGMPRSAFSHYGLK